MDKEMLSTVSNPKVIFVKESSDSNGSSCSAQQCKSSRFKGVVPQHNGHWGSQIYANHQRVWLGTFESEMEAATAYDSAAIKFCSVDFHRNFPWTYDTAQEPIFQSHLNVQAIPNTIEDGSYPSKFNEFLRNQRCQTGISPNLSVHEKGLFSCKLLFHKELTPSDVGKLNRLVIPKKCAVKYFPDINTENGNGGNIGDDVQLVFYDRQTRMWKFRYCYWQSSQSYVFTRGWNGFVKENDLNVNDTVSFYAYNSREEPKGRMFWVIDVDYKGATSNGNCCRVTMEMDPQLGMGQNSNFGLVQEEKDEPNDERTVVQSSSAANLENKGFRLFGFQII